VTFEVFSKIPLICVLNRAWGSTERMPAAVAATVLKTMA
jgi:hypothetical protein